MRSTLKSLFVVAVIAAVIFYGCIRLLFTVALAPDYSALERLFAWLLLGAELFILVHALGYALHLLRASRIRDIAERAPPPLLVPLPEVAILLAARHEPKEVLRDTFRALADLHYPAKQVYFLDDSSDESYLREAEQIAEEFGLTLFRRELRRGAKAGIVNDCLKTLTAKYIAIFDADQQPMPDFLLKLVPFLEEDEHLAFVQTPQFYSNIIDNRVARGAGFQQAVFYEYICEAKGSEQSMFCCGTNVIFRREALLSVGGFDESVVTEDFATSLKLHLKGWRSLYSNHVAAFGMGPETLRAYFTQQGRWAKGTVGVLRKTIAGFFRRPWALSLEQWWEYFLSGTYYFVGLAFLILMVCPIVYLFAGIPSFFIHPEIYVSVFVPYFALSLGIFFVTLRSRRYRVRDLLTGQILTYITFPVLLRAVFSGLLGIQGSFAITAKGKGDALPLTALWPQLTFLLLNFSALVWGLNRFYYEREPSVLINCLWVVYHWVIMMFIFYFNAPEAPRREA